MFFLAASSGVQVAWGSGCYGESAMKRLFQVTLMHATNLRPEQ